jgi:hypothetical protein
MYPGSDSRLYPGVSERRAGMATTYHLSGGLGNIRPDPGAEEGKGGGRSIVDHRGGFWLSNPVRRAVQVQLHIISLLPPGWRWAPGRLVIEPICLAPLERIWVELEITPNPGVGVPFHYSVAGTIDGQLIGEMTGYAPPVPGWHDGETDGEYRGELDLKISTGRNLNCATSVSGPPPLSLR